MILIRDVNYKTIVDAAKEFGVSPKTVHTWIANKVIPPPSKERYGIRWVQVFSAEYMAKAKKLIFVYQKRSSKKAKNVHSI